jgi:hypothetical protein
VTEIIFYTWQDNLSIYFWYLTLTFEAMGGMGVYYMGMYSFGASVAKPDERSVLLARYDGVERLGNLIGNLCSNLVFQALGYYGSYGIRTAGNAFFIVWIVFFTKEPHSARKQKSLGLKRQVSVCKKGFGVVKRYIYTPIVEMLGALFKRREGRLQVLLYAQLLVYSLYWFNIATFDLIYIFGTKVYPGFDNSSYAIVNAIFDIGSLFILLVFTPYVVPKLHVSESLLLTLICVTDSLSYLATGFTTETWQFFVTRALYFPSMCLYSFSRALLTKTIRSDEVGKIFSVLAIATATVPVASGNIMRSLYNNNIKTFPGSFWLLASCVSIVCAALNFGVYTQRKQLKMNNE